MNRMIYFTVRFGDQPEVDRGYQLDARTKVKRFAKGESPSTTQNFEFVESQQLAKGDTVDINLTGRWSIIRKIEPEYVSIAVQSTPREYSKGMDIGNDLYWVDGGGGIYSTSGPFRARHNDRVILVVVGAHEMYGWEPLMFYEDTLEQIEEDCKIEIPTTILKNFKQVVYHIKLYSNQSISENLEFEVLERHGYVRQFDHMGSCCCKDVTPDKLKPGDEIDPFKDGRRAIVMKVRKEVR
jgi:hypothetical protein